MARIRSASWQRQSSCAGIFVGADAYEPHRRRAELHRQCDVATALLTMVTAIMLSRFRIRVELMVSRWKSPHPASFWVAAIRIASPADLRHHGRY